MTVDTPHLLPQSSQQQGEESDARSQRASSCSSWLTARSKAHKPVLDKATPVRSVRAPAGGAAKLY